MERCSNCGAGLSAATNFCPICGVQADAAQVETFEPKGGFSGGGQPASHAAPLKIENYLIRSIIATICCCMPFGVVGIFYASQVNVLLKSGDHAAAMEASKKAGLWSILAIGIGLVMNILVGILTAVYQLWER